MLARKSLSQKRMIIFTALIGVVWVVIAVLMYRNFFAKPTAPAFEPAPPIQTSEPGAATLPIPVPVAIEPEVGVDLLQDPRLTSLQTYGEVPLQVGSTGRSNPFEPIEYEPLPLVPNRR